MVQHIPLFKFFEGKEVLVIPHEMQYEIIKTESQGNKTIVVPYR